VGDVHNVLAQIEVNPDQWPYNGRLVIEDCETVHIHLNNFRVEFHRDQFIQLARVFAHAADTLEEIMKVERVMDHAKG